MRWTTVLPSFLESVVMTVARAGMFTPAASVSVANTTWVGAALTGGGVRGSDRHQPAIYTCTYTPVLYLP